MLSMSWCKVLVRGFKSQSGIDRINNVGIIGARHFNFTHINKINNTPNLRKYSVQQLEETEGGDDEYYVDVSNLDNRWQSLNFEAQQDIISYLNVKQEFGWEYLTKDEKKAIYHIAYGNWGPRDQKVMSTAEFVFKLMTNMLLFSVLGFSLMNYAIDQEKIADMTKNDKEGS